MVRTFLLVIALGYLLSGCATTHPELQDADGEPLPAPVREASIVAPVEVEEVLLVQDEKRAELQIEEISEELEIDDPAETATPDLEPVLEDQVATTNVPSVLANEGPEAPGTEPEAPNKKLGEGAVAGAATVILNQSKISMDESELISEAKGESDVAAYLLDEAENSFQRENYEKARGQSERALTLEPTAARAYLILARIEIIEARPEQAAEMARQGLASSSDSDEVFEQLNQVLAEVANMQPQPAVEQYEAETNPVEENSEAAIVPTISP